jgi:hypothetical protein
MLVLAALLAACGSDGETNEWWLVDATPNGRVLELVTLGSMCSEFVGWVSESNDDRVLIEARWELLEGGRGPCNAILPSETLVLDLTGPLGDRALVGCRHDDCRALPAEGDWHNTFPARIVAGGPGAVAVGLEDIWGVEPDGSIAWQAPLDGSPTSALDELGLRDDHFDGIEALDPGSGATARLEFDGEGTWLEVYETDTGEQRHRIRVTDPEAPIGSPIWLDDGRVVLGQQQPERLWVVDLDEGAIQEVSAAAGRVQGVVGGVVIAESETRTRAIDVDAEAVLWESPRASAGERFVVGNGAVVVFDRDDGSISLLHARRGDASWTADVGAPPGVEVAVVADTLLVTTSTTVFAFDAATGELHGWTSLVRGRAETVGGTHPPQAER